jgi:flagellar assembly factor FliW
MKFNVVLPILGFEDRKEFELKRIDNIFFKLEGEDLTFALIDPFVLNKNYDVIISDTDREKLGLKEDSDMLVLNIMIVAIPLQNSTINFVSPLIFNFDNKKMGQVILENANRYSLTDPLANYLRGE